MAVLAGVGLLAGVLDLVAAQVLARHEAGAAHAAHVVLPARHPHLGLLALLQSLFIRFGPFKNYRRLLKIKINTIDLLPCNI